MPYVDREIIDSITAILEEISEADVKSNYNSDELNSNGVYPKIWHNDDSTNRVFNKRQILVDFAELKLIYQQVTEEQDYILVCIG